MPRSPISLLVDAPAVAAPLPSSRRLQDPSLAAALRAGDVGPDLAAAVAGRFQPQADPGDRPAARQEAAATGLYAARRRAA